LPNVTDGDFVYIEASSGENSSAKLIYKILVRVRNDNTALTALTVNGVPAALSTKEPLYFFSGPVSGSEPTPAAPIHIVNNSADLTNLTIVGTPAVAGVTVEYVVSPSERAVESNLWSTSTTIATVNYNDYIGIRITAQDGSVGYYKLRIIEPNTSPASVIIASVKLNGNIILPLTPSGTTNFPTQYYATTVILTGIGDVTGQSFTVDDGGSGATVTYAINASGYTLPLTWVSGITPLAADLVNANVIGIKVVSSDSSVTRYHAIKVQR
jgi:hypothetical protein